MESNWSFMRDSEDVIDKMKRTGKAPEGSFEVSADVNRLSQSIPHKKGILASKDKLGEQISSKIFTNDLVKLAEFFLKKLFLEFNSEVNQHISDIYIGISLFLHTPRFIWIKLRQNFVKDKSCNHLYDQACH